MKQLITRTSRSSGRHLSLILAGGLLFILFVSSAMQNKAADDLFKQLGISETDANSKISGSVIGASLDAADVKNIHSIMPGNRATIAKQLLDYTRQQLNSSDFIAQYKALREHNKPVKPHVKTPEEMQQDMIGYTKKSITDLEKSVQTANNQMKPVFEKTLESVRRQLKQTEDPDNPSLMRYRKGYPALVKNRDDTYEKEIANWESKYPADHLQFVKLRLVQFLAETESIDFSAGLYEKNGVKYFSNPVYESKSPRWKMAFRAGKDVVELSRMFVREWISSLP